MKSTDEPFLRAVISIGTDLRKALTSTIRHARRHLDHIEVKNNDKGKKNG
jgi:hypothetical protein